MADNPPISYLPVPGPDEVPEAVSALWDKAEAAFGFVPNVFRAQAVNGQQLLTLFYTSEPANARARVELGGGASR